MTKGAHKGGGAVEQLALFFSLVRVLRGEDPKRVLEQTAELVNKVERLRAQIVGLDEQEKKPDA